MSQKRARKQARRRRRKRKRERGRKLLMRGGCYLCGETWCLRVGESVTCRCGYTSVNTGRASTSGYVGSLN